MSAGIQEGGGIKRQQKGSLGKCNMIAEMKNSTKGLENKFEEHSQKVEQKRQRDGKQQQNVRETVHTV